MTASPEEDLSGLRTRRSLAFILTVSILIVPCWNASARNAVLHTDHNIAEEDLSFDPEGDIDDYILFALKNNPGINAAYYSWKAELARAGEVSWLPDPVLTFGYFIESIETRVGPQVYRIGIRQSFPWFGTLGAKKEAALESAGASWQSFMSERSRIVFGIRSAYIDYYVAGARAEIIKEEMELLEVYESVVMAGYRSGRSAYGDLIRVQVELAGLEERAASLGDRKDTAGARLGAVLGLPDPVDLPVPDGLPEFEPIPEWEKLKYNVIENNPDLRAVEHMIERELATERVARKSYWPDITIGFDYIQTDEAADPMMVGSGKDPWGVNLSLSLPVWFGRSGAMVRRASASAEMNRYRKRDKENKIIVAARAAFNSWRENKRKETLFRNGLVPRTEQLLEASYSAYEAGNADFIDVIVSQRQLLDYRLKLIDAAAMKAKKIAELEYLSGSDGPGNGIDRR
ncbi:MAG: TolC family protein [Bacteroidales bacterium]|nr:TolC family protein [Candidatus Latescibacterota bacterium]